MPVGRGGGEHNARKNSETVGSITSRCSGKDPALLPRGHGCTRKDSFVSLNQSDNRPQIFIRQKLSCQFGLRPVMADNVELINGIRQTQLRDQKFKSLSEKR